MCVCLCVCCLCSSQSNGLSAIWFQALVAEEKVVLPGELVAGSPFLHPSCGLFPFLDSAHSTPHPCWRTGELKDVMRLCETEVPCSLDALLPSSLLYCCTQC